MNLSIYQIEQDYIVLAQAIIDAEGELSPELETALEINKSQLQQKGIAYGFVVKTLENEVDTIDSEIARLTALKKARNRTIDKLKETLTQAMNLYEITELKTVTLKINFRKSEGVLIENEALLDVKFLTVKTTSTPNKTAIKDAIKNGEAVQGAILLENQNLQIK